MPGGEDGTYVCCQDTPHGARIATDAMGLMPLFLFRDEDDWAVSNSFLLLAEFLRDSGRNLEIDWPSLRGFTASSHRTLLSFGTPLRGIELLPAGAALHIEDGRAEVVHAPADTHADYATLLRGH